MDRRVKERLIGATILVVLVVLIVPALLSGPKRPANPQPSLTASPTEPVRNVTVDLATSKASPAADAPASSAGSAVPAAGTGSSSATPGEAAGTALSGLAAPDEGSPRAGPPRVATPGGSASDEPAPAAGHRAAAPPTITTLQAQQPAAPALENDDSSPRLAPVTPKPGVSREPVPAGSHHNWAVQLGSFASSANAEKLQRQLKGRSFAAYISSSGAGKSLRYRVRVGPMTDRAAADRVIAKLRKEGHSASVVVP